MSRTRLTPRGGVTLLELLITLSILGITLAISGITVSTWRPYARDDAYAAILVARRQAMDRGVPVRVLVSLPGPRAVTASARETRVVPVTALPDGRVLAPPMLGIDPLTGFTDRGVK